MDGFAFYNPVKVISGGGTLPLAAGEAAACGRRALFVYGRGAIKNNGVYRSLAAAARGRGLELVEHPGVRPNPVIAHAREGIALARRAGCGVVLAAGGGSVMDEAKAIAAGFYYRGDPWNMFIGRASGIERALPLVCVPTVPASGSEMSCGFVMTNGVSRLKREAHYDAVYPRAAILDPAALKGLPRAQYARSTVDMLSHLLEAYLSASPPCPLITDELVEGLARAVISVSRRAMAPRPARAALNGMMWSAALAANGLGVCGYRGPEFLCHALEHALSALYDIPHGSGLAIIMPAWFRLRVLKKNPARLARFGRAALGIKASSEARAAQLAAGALEDLFVSMGEPVRLSQAGIPASDIPRIARNAAGNMAAWKIGCTVAEAETILRAAA